MNSRDSFSDDLNETERRQPGQELGSLRSPSPPSPRTPDDSLEHGSVTAHRKPHRRDRRSTTKDVLKMLLAEETESKQGRQLVRNVLARLEAETQRAQEAERRALDLASRFKVVNEARVAAQQELSRVHEELRLYKVQYDNAQREILRGQEILRDLESQRDDAEAVAARARTEARKLREEKLVYQAREEGRRDGYREGLQRGLEQARYDALREESEASEEDRAPSDRGRLGAMSEILVANLPPGGDVPLVSPIPTHPINSSLSQSPEHVSRFHEHDIGRTPSPANAQLPSQAWPQESETVKYVRPPSMNVPFAPPDRPISTDGWIPESSNGGIAIPPAHQLSDNLLTPRSPSLPVVPPPGELQRAPSVPVGGKSYTSSLESGYSGHSTTVSQFDLVSQPPEPGRLSVIRETSVEYSPEDSHLMPEPITFPTGPPDREGWGDHESDVIRTPRSRRESQRLADELRYDDPATPQEWRRSGVDSLKTSSSKSSRRRKVSNVTVPAPLGVRSPPTSQSLPPQSSHTFVLPPPPVHTQPAPGSANPYILAPNSAHLPDSLRPPSARPLSATPSRSQSTRSLSRSSRDPHDDSQEIQIQIETPSGSPSSSFPTTPIETQGLLSPSSAPPPLPSMPPRPRSPLYSVPTVPNSPSMGYYPSMGMLSGSVPMSGAPSNGMPGSVPGGLFAVASGPLPRPAQGSVPSVAVMPVSGLPAGFVPIGPPTPLAPSNNLPMQSTPRTNPTNIYSNITRPPSAIRRQSTVSSISTDSNPPSSVPPPRMHTRSRSESLRAETPSIHIQAASPPSSTSSGPGSRGTRPSIYAAPSPAGGLQPPSPTSTHPQAAPTNADSSPRFVASSHTRSLSMNAGSTPGFLSRPLSTGPQSVNMRRVPSDASESSTGSKASSRRRSNYTHYEPSQYVDAAYLASAEDLRRNVLSPNTVANTMANATGVRPSVPYALQPGSAASSALSYGSQIR